MTKCSMCQEICHNLIKVSNNRIKALAHIILKLKGFKNSLNFNEIVEICEKCKQGIDSVNIFWETIPEARPETTTNTVILNELNGQSWRVLSQECLPATIDQKYAPYVGSEHEPVKIIVKPSKELENPEQKISSGLDCASQQNPVVLKKDRDQCECISSANDEAKVEQLKIRIKLSKKPEREYCSTSAIVTEETLPKRVRRYPKRYEDFDITVKKNTTLVAENPQKECNKWQEFLLNHTAQMASLRVANGQDVGQLIEILTKEISFRMRIICKFCCEMFRLEKAFWKHLNGFHQLYLDEGDVNIKNYRYYCKLCDKSFLQHYAVRKHFKHAHCEGRPLKCQYCEASFKYKFNLDYHMAKHVPKICFECDFCKKTFLKRYELQIHRRTHTKERPYKCEFCSLAFAHRSNLKAHQRNKHLRIAKEPVNVEKNITSDDKFLPPKLLLEGKEFVLNENPTDANFKVNSSGLNSGSIDFNFSDTKNTLTNNAITGLMSINGNNSLEFARVKEAYNKNIKRGNFKLDSSILKILPASSVLCLKKWPKSFQFTPYKDNPMTNEATNIKENNSKSKCSAAEQTSSPITSIAKYKPLKKHANTTQITNSITDSNISNRNINSKTSNIEKINAEESCGHTRTENNELLNISKLSVISSTQQKQEHFENMQFEIIENQLRNEDICTATKCKNSSIVKNSSQCWKLIKFYSRPTTKKNILNFKTSKSSTINYNNDAFNEANTSKISDGHTNTQKIETVGEISNIHLNVFPTYKNSTKQSLLKPVIRAQEISNLNLTNPSNHQNVLPTKPLITKIEILPALDTSAILPKPSLIPAQTNIVKILNDYKHLCDYCHKYFKQKSALTKHIRIHTGEKPYKCNICPKSYADASNYKKHKIVHKNAADALNISLTTSCAVQNSPAYSTVSDPDPDGIEVMQTLKKFEFSSTEDDEDVDDDASTSSVIESTMLHHAFQNNEIRKSIKRNFNAINKGVLPTSMQHIIMDSYGSKSYSTENNH